MNTTFKKTLVASAILAFAGAAQAATVSAGSEHTLTTQYLSSTGANHTMANDFAVTLGAEYVLNDTLTLTFSKPLAAAVTGNLTHTATATLKGLTFSVISGGAIGDTTVTYRLTAVQDATTPPGITSGAVLALPAFVFAKSDLTGGATVSFSAKTNTGLDLDTSGGTARTRSLAKSVNQFTVTAPSFARVIDVNTDRKSFVDLKSNPADTLDTKVQGTFNITEVATAPTTFKRTVAGTNVVKHTVTGDFSWVVDTNATTAGIQPKANVFVAANCTNEEIVVTATAVTLECDNLAANTTLTIDPEANKVGVAAADIAVLSPQSFTASSVVQLTGPVGTDTVINNASAGSWTLNGSQVRVPYMVVGGGRFGIIANVTNHGSKDGAMSLDVFAEDGTKLATNYAAGTAKAGAVSSVAGALNAALAAAGVSTASPVKFSFQVTTNVPENDVIVYAAYTDNTTSERAIVNNDSKVQTK